MIAFLHSAEVLRPFDFHQRLAEIQVRLNDIAVQLAAIESELNIIKAKLEEISQALTTLQARLWEVKWKDKQFLGDRLYEKAFRNQYDRAIHTGEFKKVAPVLVGTFVDGVIKRLSNAVGGENYYIKYLTVRAAKYHGSISQDFKIFDENSTPLYEREVLYSSNQLYPENLGIQSIVSDHLRNKVDFTGKSQSELQNKKDQALVVLDYNFGNNLASALDLTASQFFILKNTDKERALFQPDDALLPKIRQSIKAIQHVAHKLYGKYPVCFARKNLMFKWLDQITAKACSHIPDEKKKDPFVHAVLTEMLRAFRFLDTLPDDFNKQSPLYMFIHDLTFVLVTYLHPYDYEDFRKIFANSIGKRMGELPEKLQVAYYAATSGMDAFLMGWFANCPKKEEVSKVSEFVPLGVIPVSEDAEDNIVYYEMDAIIKASHKDTQFRQKIYGSTEFIYGSYGDRQAILEYTRDHSPKIYVTGMKSIKPNLEEPPLHMPFEVSDKKLDEMVEKLSQAIANLTDPNDYITFIIDSTIELPEHDIVPRLIARLTKPLQDGQLNIVLAKSFQKHVTLGTSKCKTGGVILINNGAGKFNTCKAYLEKFSAENFANFDEFQFMTCLLEACPQGEMEFIKACTENANDVVDVLTDQLKDKIYKNDTIKYYNAGPFIYVRGHDLGKVAYADTFGFVMSVCSHIGVSARFSIGLEPVLDLMRKFLPPRKIITQDGKTDEAFLKELIIYGSEDDQEIIDQISSLLTPQLLSLPFDTDDILQQDLRYLAPNLLDSQFKKRNNKTFKDAIFAKFRSLRKVVFEKILEQSKSLTLYDFNDYEAFLKIAQSSSVVLDELTLENFSTYKNLPNINIKKLNIKNCVLITLSKNINGVFYSDFVIGKGIESLQIDTATTTCEKLDLSQVDLKNFTCNGEQGEKNIRAALAGLKKNYYEECDIVFPANP